MWDSYTVTLDGAIGDDRDLVEDVQAVGYVRVEADRQLEGAVADGSLGDGDAAHRLRIDPWSFRL
jgi:hypothetical protein